MENRTNRIQWAQVTTPYAPRHCIREKHYETKEAQESRLVILWNEVIVVAAWGLAFWLMCRM
jgi:hypothetical protein